MLRHIAGRYELPTSYRATYWLVSAACGLLAGYLAIETLKWSAQSGDDRSALIVVAVASLAFALAFAVRAMTSYSFSPQLIARNSVVPFLSRELTVDHIHEGWLRIDQGASLELVADSGMRLRIPLEARLRADFATLYPEVGRDTELSAPVLSSRYRTAIWAVVTALVVGVIILAIVQIRAGLTTW